MLYTSYFAKMKKLPENCICISICIKAPDWYSGLQYKKIAPTYDLLMKWKQDHDNDYYIKFFNTNILAPLNAQTVLAELKALANTDKDIVLLCYEKSTDFCHRHLVAEWFRNNGIDCKEYTGK